MGRRTKMARSKRGKSVLVYKYVCYGGPMPKVSSDFDWSSLTQENLTSFLWLIEHRIINRPLSISTLHTILSTHIRQYLPVKVSKKMLNKVESGLVYIGGLYYSDYDEDCKKCIEIVFAYQPNDQIITVSRKRFQKMCLLFADTVLHEMIHMRQYRRRNFKVLFEYASTAEKTEQRQEQAYLGCTDEIDAYGFNIACELMRKFDNNYNKAIAYLNLDHRGNRSRPDNWRIYLKAFDHDHDHEIIKRLKQKVVRYLPHAVLGKPYKNKDWICH